MLFSQASLIFLTLLVSTSSAAAEYHARVVRRGDAGTASSSVYNTTSTGAAAVIATASNNSTISASVVSATATSATASSWPMDLGPGVNVSASLTFTLYQNMSHTHDGMTIPLPIVAFYGGGCTSLEDLNTARDWDDKAEGYYFSSSEAKKGQCRVWTLPECTGRVMEDLDGGDEPRRFRDGVTGRVSSFMCWKS